MARLFTLFTSKRKLEKQLAASHRQLDASRQLAEDLAAALKSADAANNELKTALTTAAAAAGSSLAELKKAQQNATYLAGEYSFEQALCRNLEAVCSRQRDEIKKLKAGIEELKAELDHVYKINESLCAARRNGEDSEKTITNLQNEIDRQRAVISTLEADTKRKAERYAFGRAHLFLKMRNAQDSAAQMNQLARKYMARCREQEHEIEGLKITERAYNLMAAACDSQARREAEGHDAE